MHLTDRPGTAQDYHQLCTFLVAARTARPSSGYLHLGDLLWQLYFDPTVPPAERLHLWEDGAGDVLGFALAIGLHAVTIQVHPRLLGHGVLEPAMLRWATTRAAQEEARAGTTLGLGRRIRTQN